MTQEEADKLQKQIDYWQWLLEKDKIKDKVYPSGY